MSIHIRSVLALYCLVGVTLCAAEDPFCGKWKLNQEKSKIAGEQAKIEDLGNNKYKISFGEVSDVIKADGTDQPVHFGQTQSITEDGSNTWKVVTKREGKTIESAVETLASDGNSITIRGTNIKPDGTTSDYELVAKRVGNGSGWTGTWESTDVRFSSPDEWEIKAYGAHGLTFYTPAYQDTLSMNFDGHEYTEKGPNVAPGSTSSGKRVDAHTLQITDKVKGKVMDHTKYEVSSDGSTLTLTIRQPGQPNAQTIIYNKM